MAERLERWTFNAQPDILALACEQALLDTLAVGWEKEGELATRSLSGI